MEKGRSRYRATRPEASQQRAQYRRLADKKSASARQMTYDDYVSQVRDIDKIIEVDEDNFGERLRRSVSSLRNRLELVIGRLSSRFTAFVHSAVGEKLATQKWLGQAKQWDRRVVIGVGSVTSIIVLVLCGQLLFGDDSIRTSDLTSSAGQVQGARVVTEDFEPVVPEDKKEEIAKTLYIEPQKGIAGYHDTLSGFPITISQQPLSDEQKRDPEESLSKISVAVYASGSLETKKGRAYIVQPSEDDPTQKVLFITKDLLILIRTSGTDISDEAWIEYINSIE